ncbi:hypothetical protein M426DRAFT_114981 [Hypoxylon sp. CI-4A]|nr:hypothetical protein M426DRAFT_114981 [Hypoxylon sp. CI-4A]
MARSLSSASFLRLPPAAAALLLSAVFGMTNGHALPKQTKTVELHELNVVPFPQPTEGPILLSDLLRRQDQNTVCGFIGGDPNLPATCSAGSHCVLEQGHGVVGCCPDGGTCSTGIFTGCVDRNSAAQTEINPYIYTCQGSDVCYRNAFAGGYYQFGCGTASSLATTVETSVDGMTSLVFEETSVPLTALPVPLPEPTSIGSQPPSSATDDPNGDPSSVPDTESSTSAVETSPSSATESSPSDSTPSSSPSSPSASPPSDTPLSSSALSSETSASASLSLDSSASSSSSSSSPTSSTLSTTAIIPPSSTSGFLGHTGSPSGDDGSAASPTDTSAPATGGATSKSNTGAIIGGSISGAAVLIAVLIAVVLFYLRKRRGNNREGPGPLPTTAPPRTDYVSPMRSHGAAFAPLPSWQDDDDTRPLTQYTQQPYYAPQEPWRSAPPPAASAMTASTSRSFSQPLRYPPPAVQAVPLGVGTGLAPVAEEEQSHDQDSDQDQDRGMSSSEIEDFSRAYSRAGIGTQDMEEDRRPLTVDDSPPRSETTSPGGSRSPSRGPWPGNRPLWQQNRQQGRNMMWL